MCKPSNLSSQHQFLDKKKAIQGDPTRQRPLQGGCHIRIEQTDPIEGRQVAIEDTDEMPTIIPMPDRHPGKTTSLEVDAEGRTLFHIDNSATPPRHSLKSECHCDNDARHPRMIGRPAAK